MFLVLRIQQGISRDSWEEWLCTTSDGEYEEEELICSSLWTLRDCSCIALAKYPPDNRWHIYSSAWKGISYHGDHLCEENRPGITGQRQAEVWLKRNGLAGQSFSTRREALEALEGAVLSCGWPEIG